MTTRARYKAEPIKLVRSFKKIIERTMSRGNDIFQILIFVVVCIAAKIEANMVGCFHCTTESACPMTNQGVVSDPVECYTDHCTTDAACYGIKFDVSSQACYTFQSDGTACDNLKYTSSQIYVYRTSSRSDCSLLTLSEQPGYSYSASYREYEIDPSSYENCVRECFDRTGCLHVVYKSDWSDCYVYDDCSSGCGGASYYGSSYSLYRFTCTVDCGVPDTITHGNVTFSSTLEGDTATYSCNAGYTLDGDETRVCEDSGRWSNTPSTCEPNDCGDLNSPANGNITYINGTSFGDEVIYYCIPGFDLIGNNKRVCLASGQWDGSEPTCTYIQVTTTTRTTTDGVTTYSTASKSSKTEPIYIWPCLCSTNAFYGLTQEKIIEQLIADITIDVDKTTRSLSKMKCTEDSRPSARSVGAVGIALLAACGVLVLLLDLIGRTPCDRCRHRVHDH